MRAPRTLTSAAQKKWAARSPLSTRKPHKGWHVPRKLPHLDTPGVMQAIGFRLADSLPREVITTQAAESNVAKRCKIAAILDADMVPASCVSRRSPPSSSLRSCTAMGRTMSSMRGSSCQIMCTRSSSRPRPVVCLTSSKHGSRRPRKRSTDIAAVRGRFGSENTSTATCATLGTLKQPSGTSSRTRLQPDSWRRRRTGGSEARGGKRTVLGADIRRMRRPAHPAERSREGKGGERRPSKLSKAFLRVAAPS